MPTCPDMVGENMDSALGTASLAGLLHTIHVVTGIFGATYVPARLMAREDATATVDEIHRRRRFTDRQHRGAFSPVRRARC